MTGSSADGGAAGGGRKPGAAWSSRVVWIIWAAATILALVATAVHGRWLPWSDDFDELPYVTGDKAVTLSWLWGQHNEHRIPLVKLVFVGLGRLSGADYRWTLAANALLLSATAAALIFAARRLRGHTAWTDALFPAVLLHLGQGALVWAFHTQFVLTTVLGGLFAALAVAAPQTAWRAAALATTACLMPLTGSSGLLVAAAAATFLAAEAIRPDRTAAAPGALQRDIAAIGACLTLAVAIAYVVTLRLGPAQGYAGPWRAIVAGLDAFASYPGSLVAKMRVAWLSATLLAVTGTILAAARASLDRRTAGPDRRRIMILIGYLGALALVALAIGYGRGTRDFTPLYGHYSTLALGVPVALGLLWATLPQTTGARGMQVALCLTALVVFTVHARKSGRIWGSAGESWAEIASDMRGDLPPGDVAARHAATLYFVDTPDVRAKIAASVELLRRSRFPLYCSRPFVPEHATIGNGSR